MPSNEGFFYAHMGTEREHFYNNGNKTGTNPSVHLIRFDSTFYHRILFGVDDERSFVNHYKQKRIEVQNVKYDF